MADSALFTKPPKHAPKAALASSSANKSKKSSGAKSVPRAKEAEKPSSSQHSKPKARKIESTAENAAAGSIPQDSKPKGASSQSLTVAKPTKEKKDKRFNDLTSEAKQAKRREEREKRKKQLESSIIIPETNQNDTHAPTVEKDLPAPKPTATSSKSRAIEKPSIRAKRERERLSKAKEWKVSQPIGGRFSTNTLVFSADEKYIFLAQGPSLKIFSTKTSLLYRTLQHLRPPPTTFSYTPAGNYSSIANYTLDPVNPSQIYTITFNGDLILWDWTEGTIEGCWKTDLKKGQYLAWCGLSVLPSAQDSETTTLWTYHEHSLRDYTRKATREIREINVPKTPDSSINTLESRLILSIDEARPRHLLIVDTNTFVVDSGEAFYIGNRQRQVPQDPATNSEWRIRKISTPGKILAIDTIIRQKKAGSSVQGDVAVGDNTGQIFIYHDILSPNAPTAAQNVVKSKLHWHRTGVGALKYSEDGTYLISGGRETVLILWQLSTNSRQTLPNLGAGIKNITLSPSGSTYALILADNSILTISTTELKPTSSISGIQSRVFLREEYHKIYEKGGKVSKKLKKEAADITSEWRIPCVKHPWDSMQILLAAPVSQKGESSYPFLQTFDLSQDRGVGKQAITRTLVSMKNVNPEGGKVKEPNVRFLSISGDGMWLASVDEWAAPARDFVALGAPQPGFSETVAKEVVLRFWRWNGETSSGRGSWELVSMIENPHGVSENGSAGDVADLTGSPNGAMFASVGGDGTIKIWGKRVRTRAGVKVEKDDLVVWNCRRNLELFRTAPGAIKDGRIAYSTDGSVVAVSYSDGEDSVVALVDPILGTCQQEIGGLQTGRVFAIAFVGKYLVIAGAERIVIWDLVKGQAEWASELKPLVGGKHKLDSNNFVPNIHLATNEGNGTFAVAVNYPLFSEGKEKDLTKAGNTASKITVFAVDDFQILCRKTATNGVLALEAAANGQGGNGYFWLDGAANVYFLSSGGVVSGGGAAGGESSGYLEDIDAVGGLANAFLEKATIEEAEDAEIDAADGGDERIVRSHMLAKLFPAPAYASPAVGDVFGRFMEIIGEKPLDVERTKVVGVISEAPEYAESDSEDEEGEDFEDAKENGDADVSMLESEKSAYADLPERDFDVIIDEA
ncbi:hypothetical protein TWF694_009669 [Orbilia ellipsospora]|uniref:WD40 repeat-like protein n=1 Tax=Orbilia ellipsospora TaxID=2528407 RepID=A0AAV9XCI6_9PEZI